VNTICDEGTFREEIQEAVIHDPLAWSLPTSYRDSWEKARESTALSSGFLWGHGRVGSHPMVFVSGDPAFLGGSLGVAEGAVLTHAMQAAIDARVPMVWFACGAGCRPQEGIHSLLSLGRVLAKRLELAAARLPFITVISDFTLGGSAIGALSADIVLALTGTVFGFAGRQVVKSVEPFPLPPGFQSAEYGLANGQVDEIVAPDTIKDRLTGLLGILRAADPNPRRARSPQVLASGAATPWETVCAARAGKYRARDIIARIADGFFELRGDRVGADDRAIIGGFGRLVGRPVLFLGHGPEVPAFGGGPLLRHFHMAHPSGHRKACRLVKSAARFGLPIVTLIDTPGAFPDVKAEAENQAGTIGDLVCAFLETPVPTVGVVLGEGGSGGALPFATVDRLVMLENATYSVISPEGIAAIFCRNVGRAPEAAAAMRLTAADMKEAGIVDLVLGEDGETEMVADAIGAAVADCLADIDLTGTSITRRLGRRS
jgi:acetyl-CoA carboxylase carboxyl transferase subunit beta